MSLTKLVIGAGSIYASYLTISLCSQHLFNTQFESPENPEVKEKFTYPLLGVWFSALLCWLYSSVYSSVKKEPVSQITLREQATLGLFYVVGMSATQMSSLYVSYPVQLISKNGRYFFVVIIGVFFSRVKKGSSLKLPAKKLISAGLITAAIIMFSLFNSTKDKERPPTYDNQTLGMTLLLLSLISEALFSDSQAYCKSVFFPTANQLLCAANKFSFIFALTFSLLEGSLVASIRFCLRHPQVTVQMLLLATLQVVGQIAIYFVVANFKQHVFPLISTTRKMLSLLFSIFWFNHSITLGQWVAILLLFGGLGYELHDELKEKKGNPKEK